MKKSIFYLLNILIVSLFAACNTSDVDDVFDQNSSQRLNAAATECMNLLTSAPNGWMIAYYPEENQSYGGFVYLARFNENGEVTVSGEIADSDMTETSHFSIVYSNSVTLTFDTYNTLFHYFSDPDYGGGSSYEGDFEFAYVSGDSEQMTFRGTKTDNIITFTALVEGESWSDYLDGVAEMEQSILVSPYAALTSSVDNTEFSISSSVRVLTYAPDPANPDATVDVAFCYTPDGMILYEPIEIDGTEAQHFTWNNDAGQFVSTDEGTQVTLAGTTSELYVPYDNYLGDWILDYNGGPVPVTLTTNQTGVSYTMSGLDYDLEVGYDKLTGNLSLICQSVGMYYKDGVGYYVYFCPWDATSGYLTWASGSGFDLIYNRDDANPSFTFEDNGVYGSTDSILFYLFTSSVASSSSTAGSLAGLRYVETLHK